MWLTTMAISEPKCMSGLRTGTLQTCWQSLSKGSEISAAEQQSTV